MFESEMGNPLLNVYIAIENHHIKYFYGNFQEQTVKLPEGSFSFVMLPDGIDHSFDPPFHELISIPTLSAMAHGAGAKSAATRQSARCQRSQYAAR
jgi:hypothetical protein